MDSVFVGSNRKIDPSRRAHLKADGTPDINDRVEKSGRQPLPFLNGQPPD